MLKKPLRRIATDYLRFVKTRPCAVCRRAASDAHHLVSRGAGGSDYKAIPLCREHHAEIHQLGRQRFEERHGLDFEELRAFMLEDFIVRMELLKEEP